jgi:hypothetical protein
VLRLLEVLGRDGFDAPGLAGVHSVQEGAVALDTRGFVDETQQGLQRRVALTVSHFLVAPHFVAPSGLAFVVSERVIAPYVKPLRLREVRLPLRLSGDRLAQV